MATKVLADMRPVIPEHFLLEAARQFNRRSVLLGQLFKRAGNGPAVTWAARFPRLVDPAPAAEGSDMADGEFNAERDEDATLPWGYYRTGIKISGEMLAVAANSGNAPDVVQRLFTNDMKDSIEILASIVNKRLYDGTGTSKHIAGLIGGGAFAATGTYAGIDRSTYADWASNVLPNGGTPRALTKGLVDTLEQLIYDRSGMEPDFWITSSSVARQMESIADQNVRFAPGGSTDLASGAPDYGTGFTGFTYKGKPIYRDKDAPNSLFAINRESLYAEFLPEGGTGDMADTHSRAIRSLTDGEGNLMGVPVAISGLAKTGDASKFMMLVRPQLVCKRPNAGGVITDIAV